MVVRVTWLVHLLTSLRTPRHPNHDIPCSLSLHPHSAPSQKGDMILGTQKNYLDTLQEVFHMAESVSDRLALEFGIL